jgi:hypothetical protein
VLNELFEVIRKDNDLLSTKTGHAEFLSANTCKAYSFPDSRDISLSGSIICSLVFLEHNVSLGELLVVVNAFEKDFCRKEKTLVKASFSALEDFVREPNQADILKCGERCFDQRLFLSAEILFKRINNNQKLAQTYVMLKKY